MSSPDLTDEEVSRLWKNLQKFFRENYKKAEHRTVKTKITEYKPMEQPSLDNFIELHGLSEITKETN